MRKKVCFFLSLCLSLILLPINTFAISDTPQKSEFYSAYYDLLQQRIDSVGTLEPSTVTGYDGFPFPKKSGVYYARLVDFDSDGMEEMFLIESQESSSDNRLVGNSWELYWYVYTFVDNTTKLVASDKFNGVVRSFGFSTDQNGKIYFFINNDSYSGKYYTLVNGSWIKVYDLFVLWNYDWSASGNVNGQDVWVHSDGMHSSGFKINDVWVDYNTFMAQRNFLKASNLEQFRFLGERVPDGTVQNVLNTLEKDLPDGYLTGYREPSAWSKAIIEQGIINDLVPTSLQFKYNQPITRADFCALAVNYYETTTKTVITQRAQFTDTSDINVQKMGGLGIISGVGNGLFKPNSFLTRQEAAVILARLADVLGVTLAPLEPTFSDNEDISSWAYKQVGQVQAAGIMGENGNNQFLPQAIYTREQSIVTIIRMSDIQAPITRLEILEGNFELLIGGNKTLTLIITAVDTANKQIKWSSSDPKIATVNQSGTVTAVGSGTAIITATAPSGVSSDCIVTVIQPDEPAGQFYSELPITLSCLVLPVTAPSDPDIDYKPDSLKLGGTIQITSIEGKRSDYGFTTLTINGTVSSIEDGVKRFSPYIKWILEDANGKTVESGMEYAQGGGGLSGYKVGSEFFFRITLLPGITGWNNDSLYGENGAYLIRFIEDSL